MAWDMTTYRVGTFVIVTLIAAGGFTWAALRCRGLLDPAWIPAVSARKALSWGFLGFAFVLGFAVRLWTGNEDVAFLVMMAGMTFPAILVAWFTPIEPRQSAGTPADHVPGR